MTAVLPTQAELRARHIPLSDFPLDELPIDAEGWCHVGRDGSWVDTDLCQRFVAYGYPKACDLWAERDRRDRKRESARTQVRIADAEMRRDGHHDPLPYSGGYDGELARRQANTRRGES